MPYEVEIDVARRLCTVRGIGEVSDSDLAAARAEIEASAEFRPHFSEIVDLRRVTRANVSADQIRRVARGPAIYSKESRRVVIAPTAITFGLGRMFEMLRNGDAGDIRVFDDADEALRWLDEPR